MSKPAKLRERSAFTAIFMVGTTARGTADYLAAECQRYGIDPTDGRCVRVIQIDAQRNAAAASTPAADAAPAAASNLPVTFRAAQVPDAYSLERLEAEGRFAFTEPDWATKDGQANHAAGSGGDPRFARALFECIRPQVRKTLEDVMRDFLDYRRQEEKIIHTNREPDGGILRIIIVYSPIGGFGPGIYHALKGEIADVARQHGVSVRLLTIGLALGTLEPINPDQGILNEQAFLHYAQADMVTDLDYTRDDKPDWTPTAESFLLVTNQNHHGAIPTLARLQHLIGRFLFLYTFTDMGRLLEERVVDVEKSHAADAHGGPCCVSTFGEAEIHLDTVRLLGYIGAQQLENLCETLLREPSDRRAVRQTALRDARALGVIEAPNEPIASQHVARLENLSGVDAFERALNVFDDRLRDLRGFQLCLALPRARLSTLSVELEKNLAPASRQTCRHNCQSAATGFHQTSAALLTQIDGLRQAQGYLADLRVIAEQSAQANDSAARALAEGLRPLQEILAGLETEIDHLAAAGPFVRFFLSWKIRRITTTYRLHAETDLRGQTGLALRNILAEYLFRPLLAAIGEEAARIDGHIARLEALQDRARNKRKDSASQPAERLVAVGIELVTPEFLVRQTAALISALGGAETLTRRTFQAFLEVVGSLNALSERTLDEIEATLVPLCEGPFEDTVKAMDVLTTFREEFPDPAKQHEVVEQVVHEAAGRLFTTGEAGQPINWIKLAGLGGTAGPEWFQDLLRSVDRDSGEWLTCNHGDPRTAVLLMFRSAISMDGLLRNLRRRRPTAAKGFTVRNGPDPITPLLPSVRPDPPELSATIVKGLVADLVRRGEGLLTAIDADTGEVYLGEVPQEARTMLLRSYPARVRLAVAFVRALARRRDEVLAGLRQLRVALAAGDRYLADLIDEEAILTVEREADGLWPYLNRLPPQKG
ncbi:MAG: hypothetical protein NTX87_20420 [Planctomycetota bacterium]|nr:hypothetical protein [Planctomycetota bacterium]